jgi:hypothetical protein
MREARRGNPGGLLRRCASARKDSLFIKGRWYYPIHEQNLGSDETSEPHA